jgi:hypothetical protein
MCFRTSVTPCDAAAVGQLVVLSGMAIFVLHGMLWPLQYRILDFVAVVFCCFIFKMYELLYLCDKTLPLD